VAAAVVAAIAGTAVMSARRTQRGAEAASNAASPLFHRVTFRRGTVSRARFAADGKTILYSATWQGERPQLFSTQVESPESRSLLADADVLAVSASGELALALDAVHWGGMIKDATLARMFLTASVPRRTLAGVRAADWTADGTQLAVARETAGRSRLEFPVGTVKYETAGTINYIRLSPRGDRIAFTEGGPVFAGALSVLDVTSGSRRKLRDISTACCSWSPDGEEIWFSAPDAQKGQSVYAISTSTGKERVVLRGPKSLVLGDVAPGGQALVVVGDFRKGISCALPGAAAERDLSWLDWGHVADVSADGGTLLFDELGAGGGQEGGVYLRKTDGSPAVRLGEGSARALSPDGQWALAIRGGAAVALPTAAGDARVLTPEGMTCWNAKWFPDGARALVTCQEKGTAFRAYALALDGGAPEAVTPLDVPGKLVSPDGQWVVAGGAVMWGLPEKRLLSLFPAAGGEPRAIPGVRAGDEPLQWSLDGGSLYVLQEPDDAGRFRVYRVALADGRRELWKEYTPDPQRLSRVLPAAMTRDGHTFCYSYGRHLSDLYVVEGLR
jgi:hypothetical protein